VIGLVDSEEEGAGHEEGRVQVFLRFLAGDHLRHHLLKGRLSSCLSNEPVEQPGLA